MRRGNQLMVAGMAVVIACGFSGGRVFAAAPCRPSMHIGQNNSEDTPRAPYQVAGNKGGSTGLAEEAGDDGGSDRRAIEQAEGGGGGNGGVERRGVETASGCQ